jgi:hypothetical protein
MRRKSYPENRKEVYKFWLGFSEKVTLVVLTVVIIPRVIGQLKYSVALLIWAFLLVLILISMMTLISLRLWYLKKGDNQP